MSKIEINQVAELLKRHQVPPESLRSLVEEMNLLVQADADQAPEPIVKKQHVILISDPEGHIAGHDFAGFVLQIPETESPVTTLERIYRGAYEYNASKKGRLLPVKTVGEAIESVPAKFFKEAEVWAKTKFPVLVLTTDNLIPTQPSE